MTNQITINRNWHCLPGDPNYDTKQLYLVEIPSTPERMKQAIRIGAFAARTQLGPPNYVEPLVSFSAVIRAPFNATPSDPTKTTIEAYEWNKGAIITEVAHPIIVYGCLGKKGEEKVYFRFARDISADPTAAIGKYEPLNDMLFAVPIKLFAEAEIDKFPPVSKEEEKEYSSQKIVPPPFAGKPELIAMWQKGELIYRPAPRAWTFQVFRVLPDKTLEPINLTPPMELLMAAAKKPPKKESRNRSGAQSFP